MNKKKELSLKTFPDECNRWKCLKWKEDFEAELKKSKRNENSKSQMLAYYNIGWNDCIKKILGE